MANANWFNWVGLVYGVPHGVMSELSYYYNKDCFTGMLLVSNGILGLSIFENASFENWWDWFKYILAVGQITSDAYTALNYCGYTVRQYSPLIANKY